MRRAYSYIRFSTPEQIKGDSLRRQTSLSADYCQRHKLQLDESLNLRDLGVSAFRGGNAETGALSGFLEAVHAGRVPVGAVLIVENLDRLTRDEVGRALSLFISILDSGIHIVTLRPEVEYTKKSINDISVILQAVLQLFLGHEESSKKSERLTDAWDEKRATIGKRKLTGKCPFWLQLAEDRSSFILQPERVEIVKRLFRLAQDGHGSSVIARKLNAESIPSPYGRVWHNVCVLAVLRNRAVIGEFTPHQGHGKNRKPIGQAIPDYYPAILTEAEFYEVQAAITARKNQRGPRGKRVRNLFTELVKDARDGTPMHITEKRPADPRLVSSGAIRGKSGAEYVSFSYTVFEEAIRLILHEIDLREVLGQKDGPDEVMALSGKLARAEASIGSIEAELDAHGESPTLYRRLREKETEKRSLAQKLTEAQQRAAHPLSEAWGETQGLLAMLDTPEARLRFRTVLRRVVSEILVLTIRRGHDRLAAVQLWFSDGAHHRDYLILHQGSKANTKGRHEGQWWVRSLTDAEDIGELDLRKRKHVQQLEKLLSEKDYRP